MSREEKKERTGGIRVGRESKDCSVYLVVVRMNGPGCLDTEKRKKKLETAQPWFSMSNNPLTISK